MAEKRVCTNDENGKVLCTPEQHVTSESLPRCLRHMSKEDALYDAGTLTRFLYDVASAASNYPDVFEAQGWHGMELVLDLLQDKIAIASGEYKFPFFRSGDTPNLAERT